MPSFKTTAFFAIAIFLGVQAQVQYTINPNDVPIDTRSKWCQTQEATCPLLCLQLPGESSTTAANTCDPTLLTYQCVCGNGLSPNASEYSQTLPYFICTEWGQECVANCGSNDNTCQSACLQDHPCGALDPTRHNVTSTSSTMAATATGTDGATATGASSVPSVYNGFGGSPTTTTGAGGAVQTTPASGASSGAQAALALGRSYGVAVVISGLFAGFALMI